MSSLAANMVFSNVVATLSSTLLDQIDGNKEEFLINLLATEHASVQHEPSKEVFMVSGLLEDIIACQDKLVNVILFCNHVSGSNKDNWIKSQNNIQNGNIADVSRNTEHEDRESVEETTKTTEKVDHDVLETDENRVENVKPTNIIKNHEDFEKWISRKIKRSSDVLKLQKHRKKRRTQLYKDALPEVEESRGSSVKVVTKRGRVVKKPSRLNSSILLLDKQEKITGQETPKLAVQRRSKHSKLSGQPCSPPDEDLNENETPSMATVKTQDKGSRSGSSNYIGTETEDVLLNQNMASLEESDDDKNQKKEMESKKRLRRHYEEIMPYKYFCSLCSFKSKRESHYNAHMSLHEKNPDLKLIKCESCNYTCIRQSLLKRHLLSHEPEVELLHCETCDYKTIYQASLNLHILKNHGPQKKTFNSRWKCTYCYYRTFSKAKLMKHLGSHSSKTSVNTIEAFSCEECSYSTFKRIHFERHKRNVHSNSRPFLCDLCGAAFKRTDTLAAHKITHVDRSKRKLPYRCAQCSKGFKSKAHLLSHMSVHSSVRAYQCHICGQMFKTRQVQKKHQENIHYNPRSFKCSVCKKEFNTKYTLQRHKRTHDSDLLYPSNEVPDILTKKSLNILNENKNESTTDKGDMDEGRDTRDENMSAIQHITLSEFTQHLQNASEQLQSGSDISTIYIEGLENVVQDSGAINIVDMHGQNIQQIFIPSRTEEVEAQTVHPNQYITQISAAPSGVTESINKGDNCEVTDVEQGEIYVSTVTLPDTGLADTTEIEGVYIQTDPNNPEIKHILIPSKYQSSHVDNGTIQTGEIIVEDDGLNEFTSQS